MERDHFLRGGNRSEKSLWSRWYLNWILKDEWNLSRWRLGKDIVKGNIISRGRIKKTWYGG